jgi:NAD(P) transhydrogenase subunit beta
LRYLAGIVVGSAVGAVLAIKVPMTGMPQMVGLLNGFGGGASLLVAGAALIEKMESLKTPAASALSAAASAAGSSAGSISASAAAPPSAQFLIATALSGIIGAITFWGSLVAFCKLQGVVVPERPVIFKGQHIINLLLGIVAIGLSAWLVAKPDAIWIYWAIAAVCTILGVLVVIPIGGAGCCRHLPPQLVLGLAGAATGFVLG